MVLESSRNPTSYHAHELVGNEIDQAADVRQVRVPDLRVATHVRYQAPERHVIVVRRDAPRGPHTFSVSVAPQRDRHSTTQRE
jgi:hypothetical protein